jgi:hypothetical protein
VTFERPMNKSEGTEVPSETSLLWMLGAH